MNQRETHGGVNTRKLALLYSKNNELYFIVSIKVILSINESNNKIEKK